MCLELTDVLEKKKCLKQKRQKKNFLTLWKQNINLGKSCLGNFFKLVIHFWLQTDFHYYDSILLTPVLINHFEM